MAAIEATITAMEDEGVVENAAAIGRDVLAPGLAALAQDQPLVGEVRGTGVFWAVELVADRDSRQPVSPATMGAVKRALLDRGLLPFVSDNRIHVVPPCVISRQDAERGLAIVDDALTAVTAGGAA